MRSSLAFLYPVGGEPLQDVDLRLELSYALSQSQLLLSLRVALVLPLLYITTLLIGAQVPSDVSFTPSSRATAAMLRSEEFNSATASRLNSAV